VCDVATAATVGSSAIGAIGSASSARSANKAAKSDYEYKLKVRKNRWMRDKSLYQNKQVQFDRDIDESDIAAQRAYTQSQNNLNFIREQAMLDHEKDFMSMLQAEGLIEAKAAERGVGGRSVQRMIIGNLGKYGRANATRSRALTQTEYRFKEANESIRRQLISRQNKLFSGVAIQPQVDLPPPAPVMQNPNQMLMLGLAGAAFDGMGAYENNKAPNIFDTYSSPLKPRY